MNEKILKSILKKNPNIDEKKIEKTMKNIDELKKRGVKKTQYQLATPYASSLYCVRNEKDGKIIA